MIFLVFLDVSWHPRLSQSAWRQVSSAQLEDPLPRRYGVWIGMVWYGNAYSAWRIFQEPSVGITNWSNNCYLSAVRDLAEPVQRPRAREMMTKASLLPFRIKSTSLRNGHLNCNNISILYLTFCSKNMVSLWCFVAPRSTCRTTVVPVVVTK